ncbi:odorant receptor 6 [Nasonia vitripennis]|uniref:Odorant receptor n=1 Tax=Nasonia vitripennis TaxID=7425 RepID=A0A7M6UVQ7_NASVI|nr:odorant receptor 6 [Nasonia vitripennis]
METQSTKRIENDRGFNYAVKLTRLLMISCGIWPAKFSTSFQKCLRPILIIICFFIMFFQLIPFCLFMFLIIKDMRIRLKLLGPLGFSLTSLFKYVVVVIKNREIAKCVQIMVDDWHQLNSTEDRKAMLINAKTGRVLTMVCMFLMYGGGMPYVTIVPLTKGVTMVGNVSYRHLAYPSYYIFFNPHVRPIYDVIFATHCICGFTRYTITCAVYSIVIICVMHICSRIAITSSMLQRLADDSDGRLLGTAVKHHLDILKFATKLENIFKEIFLAEVLGSTYQICLLGYYFITEYEQRAGIATATYLFLFMSFVFNIFILCYIGQILTEQCESIATTAYTSKWYQLSGREARSIILIVHWNRRRVVLTAGKMLTLSLESFSSIVKAAGGYLNILRTAVANSN